MENTPSLLSNWDCFHLEIILNLWLFSLSLWTLFRLLTLQERSREITMHKNHYCCMKDKNNLCYCNRTWWTAGTWGHPTTAEWNHPYSSPTPHSQGEAFRTRQFWILIFNIRYQTEPGTDGKNYCLGVSHQTLPEATRQEVTLWSLWLGCLHSRATRTCGPCSEPPHIPTPLWALGAASELHLERK